MATELPKSGTEEVKLDLFEDDDEFEEFDVDQGGRFPLYIMFVSGIRFAFIIF